MSNYMEALTTAWVGWIRHRNAVQNEVISLVQKTDTRFEHDEGMRKSELKRLQRSFYRVAVAEKLLEKNVTTNGSPAQLLKLADDILGKRCNIPGVRARPMDMRTQEEERYYGTVRVRWSYLLKKARVQASDDRGGDNSRSRLR